MPRLPRKLTGTTPQIVEWNAMVDYLMSSRGAEGPGTLLTVTPHGTFRSAKATRGGAGGARPAEFRGTFVSMEEDYLVCTDGTGTTVNVPKPDILRAPAGPVTILGDVISFDNYHWPSGGQGEQTRQAHATILGSPITEVQQITPPWVAGDTVVADAVDHSGVTVDGVELKWIARAEGRAWAWMNPQPPA